MANKLLPCSCYNKQNAKMSTFNFRVLVFLNATGALFTSRFSLVTDINRQGGSLNPLTSSSVTSERVISPPIFLLIFLQTWTIDNLFYFAEPG
jgi:hypothetical protein